jgi:hypothetical protein
MGAVQSGRAGPIRDSLQTGGLFRKKAKFAAARHVPRGGLWCEQRRVGFNISDEGKTWRFALGESVAYMYPCAPLYLVAESLSM